MNHIYIKSLLIFLNSWYDDKKPSLSSRLCILRFYGMHPKTKTKTKKNRKTKNTKDKNRYSFLATRSSFQMAYSYHHCMQCNSLCDFVAPLFEKQGWNLAKKSAEWSQNWSSIYYKIVIVQSDKQRNIIFLLFFSFFLKFLQILQRGKWSFSK